MIKHWRRIFGAIIVLTLAGAQPTWAQTERVYVGEVAEQLQLSSTDGDRFKQAIETIFDRYEFCTEKQTFYLIRDPNCIEVYRDQDYGSGALLYVVRVYNNLGSAAELCFHPKRYQLMGSYLRMRGPDDRERAPVGFATMSRTKLEGLVPATIDILEQFVRAAPSRPLEPARSPIE